MLGLFSPPVLLVTEGIQENPGTGQAQVPKMEKTVLLKVSTDTLSREGRATGKDVALLGSGRSLRPSETERRVSSDQREKMSVWVHQTGDYVASRGLLPPRLSRYLP